MASELFEKIFDSGIGSCVHECFCGVYHFDEYNTWDWEDGELEALQEKAKTDKKYMPHGQGIGWIEINGCDFVYGCSCDNATKYENFLRNEAERIAEFLNGVSEESAKHAEKTKVSHK
jgi:hypothetical protein